MGKRWNRKRKVEERKEKYEAKRAALGDEDRKRSEFFMQAYNVRMNAYYNLQGLHDYRREGKFMRKRRL